MKRISSAVWVLLFALLGVGLVAIQQFAPLDNEKKETPSTSTYLDSVIEFCLKPKNKNSRLCLVENPKSDEEIKKAVKEDIQKSGGVIPGATLQPRIVTQTNRIEEKSRTNSKVKRVPVPTSSGNTSTPPSSSTPQRSQQIEIPDVPDVPKVEVPKVEIPKVPEVPKVNMPQVDNIVEPIKDIPKIAFE